MDVLWKPLESDDHRWGLYEDGCLVAVIHWHGQYPPDMFDFDCFLASEENHAITRVHVTPM